MKFPVFVCPPTRRFSQNVFEVAKAFHINVMPLVSKQPHPLNNAEREGGGDDLDLNLNLDLNCRSIEGGGRTSRTGEPVIYHARNWREIELILLC